MFDNAREEISSWLNRPLDDYYPIDCIDPTFIPTRRVDHVINEAYYTVLGVRSDCIREVLGVLNFPTEGGMQWVSIFEQLRARGVQKISIVL